MLDWARTSGVVHRGVTPENVYFLPQSQHVCVVPTNYEMAGRLFLGDDISATPWNRDNRGDAS